MESKVFDHGYELEVSLLQLPDQALQLYNLQMSVDRRNGINDLVLSSVGMEICKKMQKH